MRALLEASERQEIRVVVPDVVVEEVVNAARGSFQSALKEVRRANDTLTKQSVSAELIDEPDVDALTAQFRRDFVAGLTAHHVEIANTRAVSHQSVIERDLARRKPFDESGRGYRDTLIWHAVREVCEDGEVDRVVFVTANTNDFADPDDRTHVHEELVSEIRDPETVEIVTDLGGVFQHFGALRQDLRDVIAEKIQSNKQSLSDELLRSIDYPTPAGMQKQGDWAMLYEIEVAEPAYAWGIATATVYAELQYDYSGTLEEMDLDQLQPGGVDFDIVEHGEDASYVVINGSGAIDVTLLVSYDPETEALELIDTL